MKRPSPLSRLTILASSALLHPLLPGGGLAHDIADDSGVGGGDAYHHLRPPRDAINYYSPPSSTPADEGADVAAVVEIDYHHVDDSGGHQDHAAAIHHHEAAHDYLDLHPEHHDHYHADVFESCLLLCRRDLAAKYGEELAAQLEADGFIFEECPENDADGGNLRAGRKLGATNESARRWNVPTFRRSDGKLAIPYAIQPSTYFGQETLDTIALALSTIESSSGVIAFTPRTSSQSQYILFQYNSAIGCAANVGRASPTNVYLGWCRYKLNLSSVVHEILHALGFWHEQSRPDRDNYVTIVEANVDSRMLYNFAKMTAVDSLGSEYDYSSIMHYPSWAFSKNPPDPTIVPVRSLEKWEIMGQRVRMSSKDISQLRQLYQCSTGPRNINSIDVNNLCSSECKCWEYALGNCNTDNDCMGDLECGPTPDEIPKGDEYFDQLPTHTSNQPINCRTHCHSTCCNDESSVILCPETCNTAPPYVEPTVLPSRMCLPPGLTERPSEGPTYTMPPTEKPTESMRPTVSVSPTGSPTGRPTSEINSKWYINWTLSKCVKNCIGPAPCGGIGQYVTLHDSMEACCDAHLGWMQTYEGCSTMPEATVAPTDKPTGSPTMPTTSPTRRPTNQPTPPPSRAPSVSPTTPIPSTSPTKMPTGKPTTAKPSGSPTQKPTDAPNVALWYVDWSTGGRCVRDCEGQQPCGGKKANWQAGYQTVDMCCGTMSWKAFNECSYEPVTSTTSTIDTKAGTAATTTSSTTTSTTTVTPTGWYPSQQGNKCDNDGKPPSWQKDIYSSQSTCCSNHFSWNYNGCMGTKPQPSYKWFIDWSKGKCVQECEPNEGGSCGGFVPGNWVSLHSAAEVCCRAHMSYLPLSTCKYTGRK